MIWKGVLTLLLLVLSLPSSALAAGFAKQSLFLSAPSVTDGDTVLIHAVVSNQGAASFTGTLHFSDTSGAIGTAPVSLAAGESAVASVSWKPAAGSHAVSADLKDSAGATIETQKETFVVAPKLQPKTAAAATTAAAVESSAGIQQSIGNVSPAAEGYARPVFSALDSARSAMADTLESQLASTRARLAPDAPGQVLGAEAVKNSTKNPTGAFMYILNTLYFYLLTLLRFIVGSAAVFYPVFAIGLLWLLWRGYRLVRRPSY